MKTKIFDNEIVFYDDTGKALEYAAGMEKIDNLISNIEGIKFIEELDDVDNSTLLYFDLNGIKVILIDDRDTVIIRAKLPSSKDAIWFNELLHKHNDEIALSA